MSTKLLGNLSKGLLFVLSAPAGTGKTTLVRMLQSEFSCVAESISCTTRPARLGEVSGQHYEFLSEEQFQEKLLAGEFLEHATVFGYHYGTCKKRVVEEQDKGKHVVLVIDTQGAMQLKTLLKAIYVFISPPSLSELRERLFKRKTESQERIEERLSWAKREMEMVRHYDYHIINDNLQTAYEALKGILIAEEHKVRIKR